MQRSFKLQLLIALSVTLAVLCVGIIVIVYLGLDIRSKTDSIFGIRAENYSRLDKISKLTKLKEQEKAAGVALFKLKNVLPQRDALFAVSRDLSELAREKGLSFSSKFGSEIAPTDNQPGFIRLEMNLSGSYSDLISFIKEVERSGYFINLLNFDIVRQGDKFNALINSEVFFSD